LRHLTLYDYLPDDGKVFLFDIIHLNLNQSISESLRLSSFSLKSGSFSMLTIPHAFSVSQLNEPAKSFLTVNDGLSPLPAHRQIVVIEPCDSSRFSLLDSLILNYGELHSLPVYWMMLCEKQNSPSQAARSQILNTSRWILFEENSSRSHLDIAFREIDLMLNAGLVIEMLQSEVSLIRQLRKSIGRSTASLSTLIKHGKQSLHSSPIDLIDRYATGNRRGKSLSLAATQALFHYFKFVTTKKFRRRLLILLLLVIIVLCLGSALYLKKGDCRTKPELARPEDLLKRL
jgi:hypothetical protein